MKTISREEAAEYVEKAHAVFATSRTGPLCGDEILVLLDAYIACYRARVRDGPNPLVLFEGIALFQDHGGKIAFIDPEEK